MGCVVVALWLLALVSDTVALCSLFVLRLPAILIVSAAMADGDVECDDVAATADADDAFGDDVDESFGFLCGGW